MTENTAQDPTTNIPAIGILSLLPDNLFFSKKIIVEKSEYTGNISSKIANLISEESPFPIEQLYWGFVSKNINENQLCILWYAGIRERIQSLTGDFPNEFHVLPYFALGFLMSQKDCKSYTDGRNTSILVNGEPFYFQEKENCSIQQVHSLLEKAGLGNVPIQKIKLLNAVPFHLNGIKVTIQKTDADNTQQTREIVLKANDIWTADIRDKDALKTIKRQNYTHKIVDISMRWAGWAFMVLLAFETCLLGANLLLKFKTKQQRVLHKKAVAIESKDFLSRQIRRTIEQEIRPFELLGILNDSRPNSIYFTSAIIDNLHNVMVEAIAENALDVENYRQELLKTHLFESVSVENITATHQGTKFTLMCDFKEQQPSSFLDLKDPS